MNQVQQYAPSSLPSLPLSPTTDVPQGLPPPPRLKPTLDLTPQATTAVRGGADKDDVVQAVPNAAIFNTLIINNNNNNGASTPSTPTSPDVPVNLVNAGGGRAQGSTQPYLLASRYLVTRALDSATSEAVHLPSRTSLIVKCLPTRTAMEVCSQHAILGEAEGIRPPLELIEGNEGRSWLVIAPHFGDLHSYVRSRKRIREVEAQRLFSQVARVVEQCHRAGLVLRDLKLRKFVFTDANR
ncbi:hypothetical protein HAZT_HAZT000455 [Hyalella azteca]|nr:hypothetical protein HAZT_HAZT000455 [Hyalella azteca]